MNLFFSPELTGEDFYFSEEESRHILKVLRLKEGDSLFLTDGRGTLAEAVLLQREGRDCRGRIISRKELPPERRFSLHIAIAPPKNAERLEWFLEKATEVGIEEITPLICAHSERRTVKTERLKKVLISALKQSLRVHLPVLHEPVGFDVFIRQAHRGMKFIAWCGTGNETILWNRLPVAQDITILIGPEGDFTPAEVETAKSLGFIPVSLGKNRLRTETAGILVCALAKIHSEKVLQ